MDKGFNTPLKFVKDAICLSGLTGTKLKCDVIGRYYPFWWRITSGGASREHRYNTAIIELDAATGEVHIKDLKQTVLGSAGHALSLKAENAPDTRNLAIVLIENHQGCYNRLKKVIKRRWPEILIDEAKGPSSSNSNNVYLVNDSLENALEEIEEIGLGNSLYFFDPLRSVKHSTIEKVAEKRINSFFKTGTEFLIFLFTSDWFLGRDDFAPLPETTNHKAWSNEEKKTVHEADFLFGNRKWRKYILRRIDVKTKEKLLVLLYRKRLHRWFRYVLPMPFNPKKHQIFHLILCSNYEIGVRVVRNFYAEITGNPRYSPDNSSAFQAFKTLYPGTFKGLTGRQRPKEWRILWAIITQHEEGLCDCMCKDLMEIQPNFMRRKRVLEWLEKKGFLRHFDADIPWDSFFRQYKLNWKTAKKILGVIPPSPFEPISPAQFRSQKHEKGIKR